VTLGDFIKAVTMRHLKVEVEGEKLHLKGPKDALDDFLIQSARQHKQAILKEWRKGPTSVLCLLVQIERLEQQQSKPGRVALMQTVRRTLLELFAQGDEATVAQGRDLLLRLPEQWHEEDTQPRPQPTPTNFDDEPF
jgi:hypothetical protein